VKKPGEVEFPKGKWVNLVELARQGRIKPETVKGNWQLTANGFLSPSDTTFARAKIAEVSGDYDVQIEFDVHSGKEGLAVSLPVGTNSVTLVVDGWNPSRTYLSHVNDKSPPNNPQAIEGKVIRPGKNVYAISVRNIDSNTATVSVGVNGVPLFVWKGNVNKLSEDPSWAMPDKQSLGIGTNKSTMAISSIGLRSVAREQE